MSGGILGKRPDWLEGVLEFIINGLPHDKGGTYEDYLWVRFDAEFYFKNLCLKFPDRCIDQLVSALERLKELSVISDFKLNLHYQESEDYDHVDLLRDLNYDDGKWWLQDGAPWDEASSYMTYGWPHYVSCDKEKVRLFRDIVFKKRKYLCNIGTLKFLSEHIRRIDIESLIDWLAIDEKFVFHDPEILLYSIATSNKRDLARLFFYLLKGMGLGEEDYFKAVLELEKSIVIDNSKHNFPNEFEGFYFDDSDGSEKPPVFGNSVKYDFKRDVLTIGNGISISFKEAKKQKDFLRKLLENSDRHVSSEELRELGIDLNSVLKDIRRKLNSYGIVWVEDKKLFHRFAHGGVDYCRILL